ncbi:MAG TPA: hypothetical protein G4O02_17555 [Caldilineae bacterium]|nr:hypothetical protein [Caldilineae bacterium]
MTGMRRGRARWILLALILVAWGLRLYRLDAQSLWYDEGVTAQVVQQGLVELTRWTANDIQPPLYYYIVAGWIRLAGISEWALRFPSAAWGVLAIPLIYVLGRRLFDRKVGLLAALLAAGSPLYVYYSQEARMYTQLTALGLLVAYASLRVLQADDVRARRRWWIVLVAATLAAAYTHYFAFFLLAALAVAVGILLLLRSPLHALRSTPYAPRSTPPARRSLALEALIASAIVILGYLPWLPFVLRRYRVDASYWQGQLKLGEALRHTWIHFTLGAPETLVEADAIPLSWGFAVVVVLALLLCFLRRRRGAWACVYLLGYLAIPVVLILVLSSRTPKFNPRYLMLASPALWLLIAAGTLQSPISILQKAIMSIALLFILASFGYANHSWFTDERVRKAQFRDAAWYVRAHIAKDEAVILVSGHMSPVWDYYAGGLPRVRLPDIDVLDVNAVLDYSVGDRLAEALAGKHGAWLILWQDEVVDPAGVVADILEQVGAELRVDRAFRHVGVRHFRWPADAQFQGKPPIAYPVRINFGGKVWLLGHNQRRDGELRVYWQAQGSLSEDLKVTGELVDEAGNVWGRLSDRRLSAYEFPTFRWRPGQTTVGRYALPADPGTPPGTYRLRVRVYPEGGVPLEVLDAAGAPQGQVAILAPVRVPRVIPGARPESLALARRLDQAVAPNLVLIGVGALPLSAIPGDLITVETWWWPEWVLSPGLAWQMWWEQGDRRYDVEVGALTGTVPFPSERWPVRVAVRGLHRVRVPREARGGPVVLYGQVVDGEGRPLGEPIALGQVWATSVERLFEAPPVRWRSDVVFGDRVRLVGVNVVRERVSPGQMLAVTVVWQAIAAMDRSYTAFVHLLGPDGRVVAQEDHVPGRGARPTTSWLPGEVVLDRFDLTLPAELPSGRYTLEIGLYDANQPGLPRLPLDIGGDAVRLGEIVVPEDAQTRLLEEAGFVLDWCQGGIDV